MLKIILTFLFCLCAGCSKTPLQNAEELPAIVVVKVAKVNVTPQEEKQCLNGDAQTCYQVGVRYQKASEVKMAFKFFEIGCNLDQSDSCFEAGKLKERYKAQLESEIFVRKACRLKNGDACWHISQLIESRNATVKVVEMNENENEEEQTENADPKIRQREFSLFEDQKDDVLFFLIQACDYESRLGCLRMGLHYAERQEWQNAFAFFLRACRLDQVSGCYHAGVVKRKMGQEAQALRYFFLACDKKNAESCYSLAVLYAKEGQVEKGMHLLKQALKLGYQDWEKLDMDEDLSNLRKRPEFVKFMELINSARNAP